jgi:putative FmdB family regulatory protein
MPIYAYKCDSCGFAKDVLQKISDAPLSECPSCHAASFRKQVTAAGFQLKGSGWYVTDFRGGNNGGAAKPEGQSEPSGDAKSDAGGETKTSGASETKTEPKPAAEPAAKKAAATTTTSSSGTGSDS